MTRGFKDEEDQRIERFLEYELEGRSLESLLDELGCTPLEAFVCALENGLLDSEKLEKYLEQWDF